MPSRKLGRGLETLIGRRTQQRPGLEETGIEESVAASHAPPPRPELA